MDNGKALTEMAISRIFHLFAGGNRIRGISHRCLISALPKSFILQRCLSSTISKGIDLADLTQPHSWYKLARKKKRRIVMHVGPTNSGKTHKAMQSLQESPSGIYCGPLRLLAWESYERMNKNNVPCSLITGQERKDVDGAKHKAVTVEMADLSQEYACAIVDEIQMIGCPSRGYSFTRALLGLAVDELHLCGDPVAVDIVRKVLRPLDDTIEVHYYERLLPLRAATTSLGSFSRVTAGDCIVTFSRRSIYQIKRTIELGGKHMCSLVYGSLPPETRSRQADQFNNGYSGFNVLVASDAVGMGLNLNIRRIIFSEMEKFDGTSMRPLNVMEIKQIAGRAGRFGSKFPEGEVTCFYPEDLPLLHRSLNAPSSPLQGAGLFPTFELLSLYSNFNKHMAFAEILANFISEARLSCHYFLSNCDVMMDVAKMLENLPLSLQDNYLFSISPVDMKDSTCVCALLEFATSYAMKGRVDLKEYFTPDMISYPKTPAAIVQLESIYKVFELYIWLSHHLEEAFPDSSLAILQKQICSSLIEQGLEAVGMEGRMYGRFRKVFRELH